MDLESRLAAWRQSMQAAGIGAGPVRDELESHLRDGFEQRVRAGMLEEAAFTAAAQKLGQPAAIQQEFKSALTWRSHLRRLLTEPIGVFPTDLTVCAWCALPLGCLILANVIRAAYQMSAQVGPLASEGHYEWDSLIGDLAIFSILAWIGLQLALSALGYLRTRSLSYATSLAAIWPVVFWIFGAGLASQVVQFAPRSGLLLSFFFFGFWVSLAAAYLAYRTWEKRLVAAQSGQTT